jgi:ankyrin repeat protein
VCHELTAAVLAALTSEAATTLVNTADARGNTALHGTASFELDADGEVIDYHFIVCHACMRALLAAGADPTIRNKAGVQAVGISTVLAVARRDSREDDTTAADECVTTVQALQQAGAEIDITRHGERTEHHLHNAAGAAYAYCSDVAVRLLLDCGADVMRRNDKGWTAIHSAAYYDAERDFADGRGSNADIIQMLYDAAGDAADALLNAITPDGQTALHLAVEWPKSTQKLCELGADVDARDNRGQTALLHVCEATWHTGTAHVLLQNNASSKAYSQPVKGYESTGGWQPVQFAAMKELDGDSNMLSHLLLAGAAVDTCTTAGCSAAWLVARYRSSYGRSRLELLLYKGANLWHYSPTHGSLLLLAVAVLILCSYY